MSDKNKNNKNLQTRLANIAAQSGILLMTAATTIGIVEMPDHVRTQAIVPGRAVFAFAYDSGNSNLLKREKEDTAPHYISYAETQRTHSRAGRR
ncbi:MAG TPA: hypothetical protein VFN51_01125 [Candidatus Saccharimonadales bacterium]|nr:hypothetical protein [Candidatus Saccharimonadales bacterium]